MSPLTETELGAVADFLASHGAEVVRPLKAALIAGGRSNLTVRVSDGKSRWVLRMPPRTGRTPSAHDVSREYAMIRALRSSRVPVPPAVGLCEDQSVLGAPFALFGFVAGQAIRSREDLDALPDVTIAALIGQLVSVLAALHQVDFRAAGLERFARPGSYAERQVKRWRGQWEIVATDGLRRLGEEAGAVLAARVPDEARTAIVHGDFRIDNTLIDVGSPGRPEVPRVAAVLDWELAAIGDPVADVAMMCAYRHEAFDLIAGGASAWTSSRLPPAGDLAGAYERAAGLSLADWDFHRALAFYKVAVIAAGIDYRRRAGAGSGPGFDSAGQSVGTYLELALQTLS